METDICKREAFANLYDKVKENKENYVIIFHNLLIGGTNLTFLGELVKNYNVHIY